MTSTGNLPRGQHKSGLQGKFKYQQLARQIASEIQATHAPGQRLESELDLQARTGAARTTVRKAIKLLASHGIIECRGRAGNFVADRRQRGPHWDDRLLCVAMPIRNHMWDMLFLSLSHQAIEHERYPLICDFTATGVDPTFAEKLPLESRALRLRQTLSYAPRTVVLADLQVIQALSAERERFRNLVVLEGHLPAGFSHAARVGVDHDACWRLAGHHARAAGYRRLAVFLTPENTNLARIQQDLASESGGAFPLDRQTILYKHQSTWADELRQLIARTDEPLAILCSYDWGAHLIKKSLADTAFDIPNQVGVYGRYNTAWSLSENTTSVYVDPDRWAAAIFQAIEALEAGESIVDLRLQPTIIERGSTRPAGTAFFSGNATS